MQGMLSNYGPLPIPQLNDLNKIVVLAIPHIALETEDFNQNTKICSLTEICFVIFKMLKVRKKQLTNECLYESFKRAMNA